MTKLAFLHFSILCICLAGLVSPAPAFPEERLTLDLVLQRVEEVNLSSLIGREAMEQADAAVQRTRAGLLPRLDGDISQTRTASVARISGGGDLVSTGPSNRFDARLRGRLAVLDPLQIATLAAARQGIAVSEFEYRQLLETLYHLTAQVYFLHLRNLERLEVIDSNIERAESLLRLARNQLQAGVATQIDVTRAEAQLAVEEQARLQQETSLFESEMDLKELLLLDLEASLLLAPFQLARQINPEMVAKDADAVLANRADYLLALRQLERNELERKAARYERLPTVDAFADYGVVAETPLDGRNREGWAVGVAVNVPIFEGRRIQANQRLADSRLRSQQLRVQQIERAVRTQWLVARQNARSRLAQIEVAEKNVRLAEEELRLARFRFEQGVADNREIIDAQNNLARSNDNLVEAVYFYNLSRLRLALVRGDVRSLLHEGI